MYAGNMKNGLLYPCPFYKKSFTAKIFKKNSQIERIFLKILLRTFFKA